MKLHINLLSINFFLISYGYLSLKKNRNLILIRLIECKSSCSKVDIFKNLTIVIFWFKNLLRQTKVGSELKFNYNFHTQTLQLTNVSKSHNYHVILSMIN